ncbi:hypothetical protein CU098_009144 [Rhizopus stolonifer]|uniref:Uncharacterized protein n=1 Tax=Rhizopus stolonifer TaxID=4846 RepID=A0A367JMH1_RHIST|nr:hypothetical protein CU098_009144 [Rhizopus stolonifer]
MKVYFHNKFMVRQQFTKGLDGRGIIVGKQGNETMDLEEEVNSYNLGTLMTLSQAWAYQSRFLFAATEEQASGRKYNVYSDKQKAPFFYFNRIKLWKSDPSAHKAQVEVRTEVGKATQRRSLLQYL